MKLSVVIVNYNVRQLLEACLKSVEKALEGIEGDIYVVDNNSSDGSVAYIRERFPEVHLIANKENLGFSRANNQAIRMTDAEYVLLLNPDTVVYENTLRGCVGFMDEHPETGGVGVRMLTREGSWRSSASTTPAKLSTRLSPCLRNCCSLKRTALTHSSSRTAHSTTPMPSRHHSQAMLTHTPIFRTLSRACIIIR